MRLLNPRQDFSGDLGAVLKHTQTFHGEHRPVHQLLPYTYENGAVLTDVTLECRGCKHHLRARHLRGKMIRTSGSFVELLCTGYCQECDGYSVFNMRVLSDFKIMFLRDGVWRPCPAQRTTLQSRAWYARLYWLPLNILDWLWTRRP